MSNFYGQTSGQNLQVKLLKNQADPKLLKAVPNSSPFFAQIVQLTSSKRAANWTETAAQTGSKCAEIAVTSSGKMLSRTAQNLTKIAELWTVQQFQKLKLTVVQAGSNTFDFQTSCRFQQFKKINNGTAELEPNFKLTRIDQTRINQLLNKQYLEPNLLGCCTQQ